MDHDDDDGCPECGAPVGTGRTSGCTHCGYRLGPAADPGGPPTDEPAEAADLAADALTIGVLRDWHDRPPGGEQDLHPDAADVPFPAAFARSAVRRRLDERADR